MWTELNDLTGLDITERLDTSRSTDDILNQCSGWPGESANVETKEIARINGADFMFIPFF